MHTPFNAHPGLRRFHTFYDAMGQLIKDTYTRSGMGNGERSYDADGRLISAQVNSSNQTENAVYDAAGKRVLVKNADGTTSTRFVYGIDGELVAEYASSNFAVGSPTVEYAYRSGEILVEARSAGNTWRITDSLGSVRTTLNSSGDLVNRTDHAPFGEELGVGVSGRTGATGTYPMFFGGTAPKQKYTGLERDTTTSYDHTLWRKMDNVQGRWTSPDPYAGSMSLAAPQSFNRYTYVENDPTNFTDPLGLYIWCTPGRAFFWATFDGHGNLISIDEFIGSIEPRCFSSGGGGGGSSTENNLNTGPLAETDQAKLAEKIKKCLKEMFNITYYKYNFSGKPGEGGYFIGSDATEDKNGKIFSITTNDVLYDTKGVGLYLQRHGVGNGGENSGATAGENPVENYIARNVMTDNSYKPIAKLALYLHEVANAIGVMQKGTGEYTKYKSVNAKLGIKDPDVGAKFETCVFGGLVGLQTGRVGSGRELK